MSSYLQSIEHARSASLVDMGGDTRLYEYNAGGTFTAYDHKSRTLYALRPGIDETINQWRPTIYTLKRVLSTPSQQFHIDNKWNNTRDWRMTISGLVIIGDKLIAFAGGSSYHMYYRIFRITISGDLEPIGETKEILNIIPNTNRANQKQKTITRGSSIFQLKQVHNNSYYNPAVYKFDFVDRDNELKLNKAKWLTNVNTNSTYGVIDGNIGTEHYSTTNQCYAMDMTYDITRGNFVAVHLRAGYTTRVQFQLFDEDLNLIDSMYANTGYSTGSAGYNRLCISAPPGIDRYFVQRENNDGYREFLLYSLAKGNVGDYFAHHYYDTYLPGGTSNSWIDTYGRSMAYIGNRLYMVARDGSWRSRMTGFDYFRYPNFRSNVAVERADDTYLQREYSSSTNSDYSAYGSSNNENYIEQLENNDNCFGEYSMGIGMVTSYSDRLFWYVWKNDFVGSNYPIGIHTAYLDVDTTGFDRIYQAEIATSESELERRDKIYFDLEVKSLDDMVVTQGGLTLIGGQVNKHYVPIEEPVEEPTEKITEDETVTDEGDD